MNGWTVDILCSKISHYVLKFLILDINVGATVDNNGDDLAIKFGLEDKLNYYLSSNKTLARSGFVVTSIGDLVKELDASITGQVSGIVRAEFVGVPGNANAFVQFDIADMNNMLDPKKRPSAISVFYQANIDFEVPSFLDILLMDPKGIVEAVDGIFKSAHDLSMGRNGIVTKFSAPFIGRKIPQSLKAGTNNDFLANARRTVVGALNSRLNSYEEDGSSTSTVADILANEINILLGSEGLDILIGTADVTYYEHNASGLVGYNEYDSTNENITSLMWTIPFGT